MQTIKNTMNLIIKSYDNKNFQQFIKELLTLREEIIKFDPEDLDPSLVDFNMDENMYDWTISGIGREPTKYDWEAAEIITANLRDISVNL